MQQKFISSKEFASKYKLATLKDFKYGMTYFLKTAALDELAAKPVKATNNLAADATKFQGHVHKGEAYLLISNKKGSSE